MRELVIISGKGGTGKTSIAGAFATLAEKAVLADCDVDAANLHLLLGPRERGRCAFQGMPRARIVASKCVSCGQCVDACRFGAIHNFQVDPLSCEGCGLCVRVCPEGAITTESRVAGHWIVSDTEYGPLVHAELGVAEENSGKLVAEVKRQARRLAEERNAELVLVDGPPGIGCPVISALAGADLALLVTEPSVSGHHDLRRALQLTRQSAVPAVVCINKDDLDEDKSNEIEGYCYDEGVAVVGRIPFDENMTQAVVSGAPATLRAGVATTALRQLWESVRKAARPSVVVPSRMNLR
jgi:MinD superfamily P-loop ATPase